MTQTVLLRLVAAAFFASLLGLERQLRQKQAGLRTHALVGLGSALVMIVSQHGFDAVLIAGKVTLDPSRVAAQVVSGIGFLGAGLIVVRRDVVRGLTTAAGVWVCSAIGLACGSGLIVPAAVVTLLSLLLIYVYAWIEHRWMDKNHDPSWLHVTCTDQPDVLERLKQTLAERDAHIQLVRFERNKEQTDVIVCQFQIPSALALGDVAAALLALPGVLSASLERARQHEET